MKRFIAFAALAASLPFSQPALAADVGVSVQISQPGVYGRIDIGRLQLPQLVVQQPVQIYRPRLARPPQPVYMWVPTGHRKNWRRHCGTYGACGVPVYFVRDDWYGQQIRPRADGHRGHEWRGDRRDYQRPDRWDDRRDGRRDDRRGDRRDERWDDRRDGRGPGR